MMMVRYLNVKKLEDLREGTPVFQRSWKSRHAVYLNGMYGLLKVMPGAWPDGRADSRYGFVAVFFRMILPKNSRVWLFFWRPGWNVLPSAAGNGGEHALLQKESFLRLPAAEPEIHYSVTTVKVWLGSCAHSDA